MGKNRLNSQREDTDHEPANIKSGFQELHQALAHEEHAVDIPGVFGIRKEHYHAGRFGGGGNRGKPLATLPHIKWHYMGYGNGDSFMFAFLGGAFFLSGIAVLGMDATKLVQSPLIPGSEVETKLS